MSDAYRVRIVKGADLKTGNLVCWEPDDGWTPISQRWLDGNLPDVAEDGYMVLDETPGVFLEGVTADDVLALVESVEDADPVGGWEPAQRKVRDALRKAAES